MYAPVVAGNSIKYFARGFLNAFRSMRLAQTVKLTTLNIPCTIQLFSVFRCSHALEECTKVSVAYFFRVYVQLPTSV
jgi:hypothetical protein